MKLTDFFLSQLEDETRRTLHVVEAVPEDKNDWKPHERSFTLGGLTTLVASMPGWITMIVRDDELDLNPPGGSNYRPPASNTRAERVKAVEDGAAGARAVLVATTDQHLMTPWKLKMAGQVVSEQPRYIVLRETFMHLAHHRGQLTVYLRQVGAKVPAVYGPSADEMSFA